MAEADINDLASLGVIQDAPPHLLPPEAWTLVHNARFRDGGVERMLGSLQVFGTPPVEPHFVISIQTAAQTYWLYTSLTKGYVYDGSSHTDITRAAGGDYNAGETRNWNGTVLGGIPILNNGNDVPQFWAHPPNLVTKLANLTNWPAGMKAKVIRAFGSYLVAFNIFDTTQFDHLVHWSHPADPGAVPISWDHTDPTVDAGRKDLPDSNAGIIYDALPLQNVMMIYKGGSIWKMKFIGGRFIFSFDIFVDASGILAPRCVSPTPDGLWHVVAMQDDIVKHNGIEMVSLLDKRMRKAIFDDIDNDFFLNCFMYTNYRYNEVVFCYPSQGNEHPNKAVVWNAKEGGKLGALSTRDIDFRNAAVGAVEGTDEELWSDGLDTWDDDTGPWGLITRRELVVCKPTSTKFLREDVGLTRDGMSFEATARRQGLALLGKNRRTGDWIVDVKQMKMAKRVQPKADGGPIRVRLGQQMKIDGPISWSNYFDYDPSTQDFADLIASGRLLGIEFSSTADVSWKVDGYKYDVTKLGQF